MKIKIKHPLVVFLVPLFFTCSSMAGGTTIRGGGDSVAMEFKDIGLDIAAKLGEGPNLDFPLAIADVKRVLQSVKVQSVRKPLIIDGEKKDAINYPLENRVQIDLQRWLKLSQQLKVQLVAHEILGLLQMDDANYLKSREIFLKTREPMASEERSSANKCSEVSEHLTASVSCPVGQKISKVVFAGYGTPSGSCGSYKKSSCNSNVSVGKVQSACLNKESCSVTAENRAFGDPCPGLLKTLAIDVQCSGGLPDMVVTSISTTPANPLVGDPITFSAVIKNRGTVPTPPGIITGVAFFVDRRIVSWSDNYTGSIAPGASITLTANGGPNWPLSPVTSGDHQVLAWVNAEKSYPESNVNNNQLTKTFQVAPIYQAHR